ncbi:MAG: pyridoxal phosphate-dependent aminotransferase [Synergistaceae bacterium]|nr:pyridoxal phosphate-dependent aminotransferase [Synergistaceae bacterium]
MKLSQRAKNIAPSATLTIAAKAKELKAQGNPILSFSAGEPDFTSPRAACDAAIEAIKRGETHYTANSGIIELKKAVSGYYKTRFGLDYPTSEIIVTSGAKPLLYETLQVLVDPGDEVLLFAPAWVSYVEQINLAGGLAVSVGTSGSAFVPTRDEIEKNITSGTTGMIINTPNNPTGAVYDERTLRMLANVALERGLWIIFDEIYERLVYGEAKHTNILNVAPEIRDRVILANGVSKAYCMTGWRIGYALGPREVIMKVDDIQSHLTSNASSIAQWASVGAINGAEADVERRRGEFEKRRDLIYGLVSGIDSLHIQKPEGAFYVFIDVRDTPISDDIEFCQRLLEERHVAVVPGAAFLAPGFLRMSYACSEADIREGVSRLRVFVDSL